MVHDGWFPELGATNIISHHYQHKHFLRWTIQHIECTNMILVTFDLLENNSCGNDTHYLANSLDEVGVFCLGRHKVVTHAR
jgi:hypothetical protein